MVILASSNDGSIQYFELIDEPVLVIEDGNP